MGLRVVDTVKSATLIEGLYIDTMTAQYEAAQHEQQVTATLGGGSQFVDPEAVNIITTSYTRDAGTFTVHRAEALLVQAYRATLDGMEVGRLRRPAGLTDLHVVGPAGTEIIEAKRAATHIYVRQALGQLLDYVAHSPQPASLLTALFPESPADDDIALLHRYGIDCLYRTPTASFARIQAPAAKRDHMKFAWRDR